MEKNTDVEVSPLDSRSDFYIWYIVNNKEIGDLERLSMLQSLFGKVAKMDDIQYVANEIDRAKCYGSIEHGFFTNLESNSRVTRPSAFPNISDTEAIERSNESEPCSNGQIPKSWDSTQILDLLKKHLLAHNADFDYIPEYDELAELVDCFKRADFPVLQAAIAFYDNLSGTSKIVDDLFRERKRIEHKALLSEINN